MACFSEALPYALKHEGGWSCDADDPGGATNQGITLATAKRHGITDAQALKQITPAQVALIYQSDYWRFNGVASQRVATKLFDMAVNMGLMGAVKLAQDAANSLGACLTVDGVWGRDTEACVNAVAPDRMLDLLCRLSAERYQDIAARRPSSEKFLHGWLKRAMEVPN